MNRPRVLVADDHRIVAEGLRGVLEPEFELVEIVEDGRGTPLAMARAARAVAVTDAAERLAALCVAAAGGRA
jgi:DNA-binding NarL/FixJ family response regulator